MLPKKTGIILFQFIQYWNFSFLIIHININLFLYFRDLGEFIRDQFKLAFKDKQFLFGSEFECNRNLESLKRLSENYHGNKYKRTLDSSSTGLTAEECKQIMSNEFLNENRK